MKSDTHKAARVVLVLLAMAFVLSAVIQFVILEKYKNIALSHMTDFSVKNMDKWAILQGISKSVSAFDLSVVLCSVLLVITAAWMEIKRGYFKTFITIVMESGQGVYWLILFVGVLSFKSLLLPGEPFMVDSTAHMSRGWFSYLSFKDGYLFPFYTTYYHNGFTQFTYYGFIYYILTALTNLLVGNIFLSAKLVLFTVSILNMYVFFTWGMLLFKDRSRAFLFSLFIIPSHYYLYQISWIGMHLFPMVFLSMALMCIVMEKYFQKTNGFLLSTLLLALSVSIVTATHLGFTVQVLVFFIPYCLLRCIVDYKHSFVRLLSFALVSMGVTLVLNAFIFLPTYLDMPFATFYKELPFAQVETYQFWKQSVFGFFIPKLFYSKDSSYLGLSLLVPFIIVAVRSIKAHKADITSLVLIAVSFGIIGYSRNTILLLVAVSLFTVTGLPVITRNKRDGYAIVTLLFMCILLDRLLFSNFNTYNTFNGFEHDFYTAITSEENGQKYGIVKANTLHTGNRADNQIFVSPWMKVIGHRFVHPNALMIEANTQSIYQYGITGDVFVKDVRSGKISNSTAGLLALAGIKYLTFHTARQYYVPDLETDPRIIRKRSQWYELKYEKPFTFSHSLTSFDDAVDMYPALQYKDRFENDDVSHSRAPFHYREYAGEYLGTIESIIQPDMERGVAQTFLVAGAAPDRRYRPAQESPKLLEYHLDSQRFLIRFTAEAAGYVRVPFAYYPFLNVRLNGEKAEFYQTVMNFIVLEIPAPGEYTLEMLPSVSPARKSGLIISLIALTAIVSGVVYLKKRDARFKGSFSDEQAS